MSPLPKPRLESAVLTREDTKIWLNINLPLKRTAPNPFPSIAYFTADGRDAGLMLGWQRIRIVSEGRPLSFPNVFWLCGDEWELAWQPAGGQL